MPLYSPRSALTGPEIVVAAYNASEQAQAMADYVCDGVADNVEIQAAIDSLPASGGKVLLTEGSFLISGTVSLPSTKRMTLAGLGPVTSELYLAASANCEMLLVQGQQQVVTDLSLNGNYANNAAGSYGIRVTNTKVWLERLWITNTKTTGIYIIGTAGTPAHANKLTNLYLSGCQQDGIELGQYAYDAQLNNVWIGTSGRDGVRINTSNIMMQNVHSWGNTGNGIYVNSGSNGLTQIFGSYCEQNGDRGIRLGSSSPGCVISGTICRQNVSQGIYAFSSDKLTVQGCTIIDSGYGGAGQPGIKLDTVTGAVITGSTFYDTRTAGSKTQTYAIADAGGADYVLFVANDARAASHKTGSTSLVGANNVVASNLV